MEYSKALFKIDSESSLPIHVQIKEQIKLLIGKDFLKPGDILPSTNQLANQLAINRNTIQSVYSQLKEDGLLTIQRGKGTQVADIEKINQFKAQNPYFTFLEQIMNQADDAGYPVEKVLLSGFAYIQLFGQPLKKERRYLFVDCQMSSCIFYLDEIKRMTSAEIHKIDVSTSKDLLMQSLQEADVIITRSDIAENLKSYINDERKKIISVGSTNDVSLLLEMLIQH